METVFGWLSRKMAQSAAAGIEGVGVVVAAAA
jgi:hypothetical protein